jgi:hypothetical protein
MMSDPERLFESPTADPQVRELLQSLRKVSPEPGTGAKSWAVMSAKIAVLPVLATASKSAAQTVGAVSKAVALKVAAGAVATALLGTGVLLLRSEHAPPPEAKPVLAVTAAPVIEPSVAPAEPPKAEPEPAARSEKAPPATRRSLLDAEASLLSKARSELRSGNTGAAEAALNQLQSTFPRGQLGQEREVLAVEVLAANGSMAAARRRARAFIAAHPTSPHSAKLERLVGER